MEHLIGFINQCTTSRLACSVTEVFKLGPLLGVTSRIAGVREQGHSILALDVISIGWLELILFIRLDDFVFATKSLHHCVVGRVLSLSDPDGHISPQEEHDSEQGRLATSEDHDVVGCNGCSVMFFVVVADSLT